MLEHMLLHGTWGDWFHVECWETDALHRSGITLTNATDFNNLTTAGVYKVQSSSDFQTMLNTPYTQNSVAVGPAKIYVENIYSSSYMKRQTIYFANDFQGIWTRVRKNNTDWTSWLQLAAVYIKEGTATTDANGQFSSGILPRI